MLHLSAHKEVTESRHILLDCPRCGIVGSSGIAYTEKETLHLFFAIPLWTLTHQWVACEGCKTLFPVRETPEFFLHCSADEVALFLSPGLSTVWKIMAVLSIPIGFVPVAGVILGAVAVAATHRDYRWPFAASLLGVAVGVSSTAILFIALVS